MGFTNLLLYATPFFLLSMWIEYKHTEEAGNASYTRQDFLTNGIIGVVGFSIAIIIAAAVSGMLSLFYTLFEKYRLSLFGYQNMGWGIGAWAVAFILDDFTYYWFHRTSHRIRLIWACHIVHHNSTQFNFSTAIRNSWIAVFYKPLYWIWLAALGFHPLMIITCLSISACYQFFCHTELLPAWDKLSSFMTTPGLHAIHHGKEDQCIDKNYAGVFIFFDRIFGTYQPIDRSLKITFGVTRPPQKQNFLEVSIHEFRDLYASVSKARSVSDRIKCLFKGPEWNPGQSKSVKSAYANELVTPETQGKQ